MKKVISLLLMLSILLLSGNMFAQKRKGADLIIQKIDGSQIRGELIAAKNNSLLLMERDSGADVTVDIKDVRVISIGKKSKLLIGAGIGFLAGAIVGGLYGGVAQPLSYESFYYFVQGLYFGVIGSLVCGIIGGIIGAALGKDETIRFEGKSNSEIQEILEKLRKKARVENYQ